MRTGRAPDPRRNVSRPGTPASRASLPENESPWSARGSTRSGARGDARKRTRSPRTTDRPPALESRAAQASRASRRLPSGKAARSRSNRRNAELAIDRERLARGARVAHGVEPEVDGGRERLESVENAAAVEELFDPRALGRRPPERIDGDDRVAGERKEHVLERRGPGEGGRDDRARPDVDGEEQDEGRDDAARERGRAEMTRGRRERESDAGGDREKEPLVPAEEPPHRGKDGNVREETPRAGEKRATQHVNRRTEREQERRDGERAPEPEVGFGALGIESERDRPAGAAQKDAESRRGESEAAPGRSRESRAESPGRSPSKTARRGTEKPEW